MLSTMHSFPAEISFDHNWVLDDIRRLAAGNQLAVIEHAEMIHQLHHGLHRVLDDGDGDAVAIDLADDLKNVLKRVVRKTSESLGEQQKPGTRGKRSSEFHQPQLLGGQPASDSLGLPVGHSNAFKRRHCEAFCFCVICCAHIRAYDNIFQNSHARKCAHDLKCAANAVSANFVGLQADQLRAAEYDATVVG